MGTTGTPNKTTGSTKVRSPQHRDPAHNLQVPATAERDAVPRAPQPGTIGQRIVDRLRPLLKAHHCGLYLWDPITHAFATLAAAGDPVLDFDPGPGRGQFAAVLARVLRDRRPVVTPDLLTDPPSAPFSGEARDRLGRSAFRAVLALPLLVQGRVVGALGVADRTGRVFDVADLHLAQTFAGRAAICVESARLRREGASRKAQIQSLLAQTNGGQRRVMKQMHGRVLPAERSWWRDASAHRAVAKDMQRRVAALSRLAALVSSSLDPQHVFGFIAEAASRLLDGAASLLLLPDETGEAMRIAASRRVGHGESGAPPTFSARHGAVAWVFQQREALVIPDLPADPRTVNRNWMEAEGLRAFAGVPLMLEDRCLGVLCVMRKDAGGFETQDVELLGIFASHAAIAIQNARLYEQAHVERERLRAILEAIPEAVLVAEGSPQERTIRWVMANRVYRELLRLPDEVPRARTETFELLRPDGSAFEDADLPLRRAIWRGQAVRAMEIAVRFFDGDQRSLLASAAIVRESPGLRQAVAVFEDITERKLLEQQAQFEAARLAAIMDTIPEPLFIVDAESGVVLHANRVALEFRAGGVVGARLSNLGFRLRSADGARALAPHKWPDHRACRGETIRGEQVICQFPDGRRAHYLVSAAPVQDPQGRPRQAVVIAADVSPLKRAEGELEHLAADNRALYVRAASEAQVKGILLEELNHRVRNSLDMIVSFIELQRESLDAHGGAVLEDIAARVRGLALVHQILAAGNFQASEYGPLARGLAEQTLLRGPLAGRVAVHLEDRPLRLPSAQLSALGLITNELFTNIARHAFPHGRKGTVRVTMENAGPDVTIRVRDDGVGLPAGVAEGSGRVGLRLVRSLTEVSLRGTFALEAGEGTTAVLRFPHSDPTPNP